MTFLSLLDPRARPKGSRDPLGFEMVWTHFGRRVVGNLTTVTSSWKIFAVALLGFHWCNQACRNVHPSEKQKVLQDHFVRFEQLAGFLRSSAGDHGIMGITRVRQRLSGDSRSVRISIAQDDLILSNQISYGMWGLYSSALRESGLVDGEFRTLTEKGLEIARAMEAELDRNLYKPFIEDNGKKADVEFLKREGKRFVKALEKARPDLIAVLLRGPSGHQVQHALYEAIGRLEENILKQGKPAPLVIALKQQTGSQELKQRLNDIENVERLLVAANTLFDYCRRKDGEKLVEIARQLNDITDFSYLPPGPDLAGCPYSDDLERLRSQLRKNETLDALRSLLKLNGKIMHSRNGAAWVEERPDGRLHVRVNLEVGELRSQEDLQKAWDYDYFLGSFAGIAREERAS